MQGGEARPSRRAAGMMLVRSSVGTRIPSTSQFRSHRTVVCYAVEQVVGFLESGVTVSSAQSSTLAETNSVPAQISRRKQDSHRGVCQPPDKVASPGSIVAS